MFLLNHFHLNISVSLLCYCKGDSLARPLIGYSEIMIATFISCSRLKHMITSLVFNGSAVIGSLSKVVKLFDCITI